MQSNLTRSSFQLAFDQDDRAFVHAIARRYVHDDASTADVTQDALLTAFRHRATFRGDSHYRTWLYRIATTTALTHLRREGRRRQRVVSIGDDAQADSFMQRAEASVEASTPESLASAAETEALVERHLAAMGDKYRHVFLMRYRDGYSETEIAEALGLSVATVKIRAHRARHYLRQHLRDDAAPSDVTGDAAPESKPRTHTKEAS
jgi:RNA polymerase sigma-70 factor (ECF subfamily)